MKNISLIIVFTLIFEIKAWSWALQSFISSLKSRTIENEWHSVTKVFSGVNVAEKIKSDIIHYLIIPVQSGIIELTSPSLLRYISTKHEVTVT